MAYSNQNPKIRKTFGAVLVALNSMIHLPAHGADADYDSLKQELAAQRQLIQQLQFEQSAHAAPPSSARETEPRSVPPQESGVQFYGVADAGFVVSRTGAPGAGSVKAVASGMEGGSRLGLRASQSLIDGMKALLIWEEGVDVSTGGYKSYSGSPTTATPSSANGTALTGFNRRAVVGLDTRYGTLTFGRDYTPVYYALLGSDAFHLGLFANLQETVALAGGSDRWARASDAVFFTLPKTYGLTARVAYSFGSASNGIAGSPPKGANDLFGIGGSYEYGQWTLNASYQQLKYPLVSGSPLAFTGSNGKRTDELLGVRYVIGPVEFNAGHWKISNPQNASDSWLGAGVNVGKGIIRMEGQRLEQRNSNGSQRKGVALGLGYLYPLAKQVRAYVSYGRVNNGSSGSFGVVSSDYSVAAGTPHSDPSALGIGLRYDF